MSQKVEFFDTNVLVAASIHEHEHHERCSALLVRLSGGGGACASHTLAEAYTTLTRLNRYAMPPVHAARILQQTSAQFQIVTLAKADYLRTIQDCSAHGLAGAIIYDALLIACARKVSARRIYTHNVSHFRKIAPDLASRILEP